MPTSSSAHPTLAKPLIEKASLTCTTARREARTTFQPGRVGGGRQGTLFGSAVGTAGDVNGDDYVDVIVGAPDYNNGTTKAGGAFVFYGSVLWTSDYAELGVD